MSTQLNSARLRGSTAQEDSGNLRESGLLACLVVLAGRILYSAIFLEAAPRLIFHPAPPIGVPLARIMVPLAGVIALAGGLSVLLGYRAKTGGWLLVLFLVPVTLVMHNFWAGNDPRMAQMQMTLFLKNASILGGALLISHFGVGPFSIDSWRRNDGR